MTELKRCVIGVLFAAFGVTSVGCLASGPSEPMRELVKVNYADSTSIAVDCRGSCAIVVALKRKEYVFGAAELLGEPIASAATLYTGRALPGSFSFQVEIECSSDDEKPPFRACFGSYLVEDGKIIERRRFSRVVGRDVPLK
jgi:hypothetical protein